jgi:Flp pilus assembly protein TadB
VNPLPVVASLLAGAAVALLAAAIVESVQSVRHRGVAGRSKVRDLVRAALGMIALPAGLERRWGGERVEQNLHYAGVRLEGHDFSAARWALLWLGLLGAVLVGVGRGWDLLGQFLAVLVLVAAIFGPGIWLQWRIDRRRMEIDFALPDFLDRLALGMDAGLGFEVALRRTAHDFRGLLGDDLRLLVRQLDRGHARVAALQAMVRSTPSDDLHAFVAAVQQSDKLGTSLARALRVQTALLRARRRRRAQEASRRLPILIIFPLVFFFLPALLIIYLAPPLLHLFLGR